jgi:nicotinamidase-related amidase
LDAAAATGRGSPSRELSIELPRSRVALLVIDMINPLRFDGAEDLAEPAVAAARCTAALKRRLAGQGVPAIYVNDNFGHWRSDFQGLVALCRRGGGPSAALMRQLAPHRGDLTVLKPRHSAFFGTPLDLLLERIGARKLVITGLATDLCVQFSAADAYVHGFRLWVPEDCTAAESPERKQAALNWMRAALTCRTSAALAPTNRRKR